MERTQFLQILSKYIEGRATEEEEAFLLAYYDLFVADADVMKLISAEEQQQLKLMMKANIDGEIDRKATRRPTIGANAPKYKLRTRQVWLVSAAAVAAITLGVWLYYSSKYQDSSIKTGRIQYATDIAPGKNTATLTLASGEVINLSDQKTGVVIGNEKISYSSLREGTTRQSHDEIASIPRNDGKVHNLAVSTPRGGQYQVVLPDGTKVWLNADSKLEFPSQFSGKERKVLLEGEAYFEVAKAFVTLSPSKGQTKRVRQSFIVESAGTNGGPGQQVEVLGTHFNISSYADEGGTKTTLLEGSVRIAYTPRHPELVSGPRTRNSTLQESIILKPGQQAILTNNKTIKVKEVDVNGAVDWKNGKFVFESESLGSIMRKVSRWYNVDVSMSAELSNQTFTGSVSRFESVSALLNKIEMTNTVHFKIEGRRILVTR